VARARQLKAEYEILQRKHAQERLLSMAAPKVRFGAGLCACGKDQ
jgi:hypothetical protein